MDDMEKYIRKVKDLRVAGDKAPEGSLRHLEKKDLFFDITDKRWLDHIDNYLRNRNVDRAKRAKTIVDISYWGPGRHDVNISKDDAEQVRETWEPYVKGRSQARAENAVENAKLKKSAE